jgi:hypothetical protein
MKSDDEMLYLTDVAALLDMRKSNVRKYLDRHGIEPVAMKDDGNGHLWSRADLEPLVQMRREQRAEYTRRREGARRSIAVRGPYRGRQVNVRRLGPTSRRVLAVLLDDAAERDPIDVAFLKSDKGRGALRVLRLRGFVSRPRPRRKADPPGPWRLTNDGFRAVRQLGLVERGDAE